MQHERDEQLETASYQKSTKRSAALKKTKSAAKILNSAMKIEDESMMKIPPLDITDPDVSKALAGYNIVSPRKNSPAKVKPGQMNIFNPGVLKTLDFSQVYDGPLSVERRTAGEIEDLSQDTITMRNTDLSKKTQDVQAEFAKLMEEMSNRRGVGGRAMPILDDDWEEYKTANEKKHKSPTKRLISLKNSTWDHKKRISHGISKGDYS